MPEAELVVVVLAAGQGTRMKSSRPKVLHEIAGRPMLAHVLDGVAALAPERIVVVIGPGMDAVAELATSYPRTTTVVQAQRLGTGHAVAVAGAALGRARETADVLVVCGDTPLLRPETLRALVARRYRADAPDLLCLAFRPEDANQYGRVVVDEDGNVQRIVEFADADEAERANGLCNAGILLGAGAVLFSLVGALGNDNAKGEYYLTDVFALATAAGRRSAVLEGDPEDVLGVNSQGDRARAEEVFRQRLRDRGMAEGVTLLDPATTWLSADTDFGRDVVVEPAVFIGPGVALGDGVRVRAFSHLEGVRVEAGAVIGPFARLRPGSVIGSEARIGNFVEVKNATLGSGAKANHLSYVGDSAVGAGANVGAGTITCNYDGLAKHRTEIGAGAFIGSNTALVAPVRVGAGAIVGAGSTITRDVPADALAVARGEQREVPQGAARFRARRGAKGARSSSAPARKPAAGEKSATTGPAPKSQKQRSGKAAATRQKPAAKIAGKTRAASEAAAETKPAAKKIAAKKAAAKKTTTKKSVAKTKAKTKTAGGKTRRAAARAPVRGAKRK